MPEPLRFTWNCHSDQAVQGDSMTVAAVLSAVDTANNHGPDIFARACAVVELDVGGRLRPVGKVKTKLAAMIRECELGTLLVCHPTCRESDAWEGRFEQVWRVESMDDLADRLEAAGLLAPFLKQVRLTKFEFESILNDLRRLERSEHSYLRALDLAKRLAHCQLAEDVDPRTRNRLVRIHIDLYRHTRQHEEASKLCRQLDHDLSRDAYDGTHHDLARAETAAAATDFLAHRFAAARDRLETWRKRIDADPRALPRQTKVRLLNTLGRAKAVLNDPHFEDHFRHALEMQEGCDVRNVPRTRNYLILALLRNGRIDEARAEITLNERVSSMDDFSRWILSFAKAELARIEGTIWSDTSLESCPLKAEFSGQPPACYFQATARQAGRGDAEDRFARAAELFARDVPHGGPSLLRFYAAAARLAEAAWRGDRHIWCNAVLKLHDTAQREGEAFRAYYADVLNSLGTAPDRRRASDLLDRLPLL